MEDFKQGGGSGKGEIPGVSTQPAADSVTARSLTNFHYTIKASQNVVDAGNLNLPEGAVIGIEAGTRGSLLIRNINGKPGKPVTIINQEGKVIIKSNGSYGLKFENSKFFRLTGSGVAGIQQGIEVNGGHIGVSLDNLSTNFEVDNMEVHHIGFAGIMAKTDPSCNPATWRENFVMKDVSFHDNYIHHVGGEGFYIGNSFYTEGRNLECGEKFPHNIIGVRLYNNVVKHSDAEGIQVGCAIEDCEIYNNRVEFFGQKPFANFQNNGIQIGAGTGGKLYNNFIKTGPGNGIIVLGIGDNVIFNNIIVDVGSSGIFCDERTTPGPGFTFVNNTIVNPKGDGMKLYSEMVPMNTVINNIIVNPGSGKYLAPAKGVKLTESNNLFTPDINSVKFVSPETDDYGLKPGSPAINKGASTLNFGVSIDFRGLARPQGNQYDIGAFESDGTPSQSASITGFSLIDASSGNVLKAITEGAIINLTELGTLALNIQVDTTPSTVEGVVIRTSRAQKSAPYTVFAESQGTYSGPLTPGSHTLTATILQNGAELPATTKTVNFRVVSKSENSPPEIAPIDEVNMNTGGSKSISINATDPDGDDLTISVGNLPAFASFQQTTGNTGVITLNPGASDSGAFTVKVSANDGRGGIASADLPVMVKSTQVNTRFIPSDDAYLENGRLLNNPLIRVEANKRVSYLKFSVTGLGDTPATQAILRLTVGSDPGFGTIRAFQGAHNNWTENLLPDTGMPTKLKQVGQITADFTTNSIISIDITEMVKSDGTYTVILEQDPGGNDIGFMSKEGKSAPELIVS